MAPRHAPVPGGSRSLSDVPFRLRQGALPKTADVVIVGAGVVGCATAFYTTAAGLRTVVLDARPGPATLTTAAATGAYRLQHDNAEELALVREGVDLLFDYPARLGLPGYDIRLRPQGYLFCTTEPAGVERQRRMVERQRGLGLTDVELLSGDEARARFPYISARGPERPLPGPGRFHRPGPGRPRLRPGGVERARRRAAGGHRPGDFCLDARINGVRVRRRTGRGRRRRAARSPRRSWSSPPGHSWPRPRRWPACRSPWPRPSARGCSIRRPAGRAGRRADDDRRGDGGPLAAVAPGSARPPYGPTTPPGHPPGRPAGPAQAAFRLLDPASPVSVARISPFWADAWRCRRRHRSRSRPASTRSPRTTGRTSRRPPFEGLWLNGGYSGHGVMGSAGGSRLLVDLITGRSTAPRRRTDARTPTADRRSGSIATFVRARARRPLAVARLGARTGTSVHGVVRRCARPRALPESDGMAMVSGAGPGVPFGHAVERAIRGGTRGVGHGSGTGRVSLQDGSGVSQ